MKDLLQKNYGYIFEEELINEIVQVSILEKFKKDDVLIDFENYIKKMPLILSGAIKILREDIDEGEMLLYYIEKGDTCALSMTCCMEESKSQIKAIAETNGQMILLPINKMEEWLGKYKSWRDFVLNSYNNRIIEMYEAIDTLAFMNMDERLLKYLLEKFKINNSNEITNTHQEIAFDLNTSRVVISRLLKALENKGKIQLNRSSIFLLSK